MTPPPAPTVACASPTFTSKFTGNGKGAKAHEETLRGEVDGQSGTTSWTWTFGDGSTPGSGQTSRHAYAKSGTYTVTLTVASDACGTSRSTASVIIP